MKAAPDQILRPKTLEEAGSLLERLGDEAGLLWLGARVEPPETWARPSMIDLSGLNLDYIKVDDSMVAIGGGTPIQNLTEDEFLAEAFGGLIGKASRRLAHYGLRNLATVGGAVMTRQGPPELALALLALGAEVVIMPGERSLALDDFWADDLALGLCLIQEVRVPRGPGGNKGWGLEWLARSPMDQALAAACAAVEVTGDKIALARLAVASVGWAPARVREAEMTLKGGSTSGWAQDDVARAVRSAVSPEADFRASAKYQQDMMVRLAGRAMAASLKKVGA